MSNNTYRFEEVKDMIKTMIDTTKTRMLQLANAAYRVSYLVRNNCDH